MMSMATEFNKLAMAFNQGQMHKTILSQFTNHFPYWVKPEITAELDTIEKCFKDIKQVIESLHKAVESNSFNLWALSCEQASLNTFQPSTTVEKKIKGLLKESLKALNYVNNHLTENSLNTKMNELIQAVEATPPNIETVNEKLQTFIITLIGFKQGLIQQYGLKHLRSREFQEKSGLSQTQFLHAKRRYEKILLYKKFLKSLSIQTILSLQDKSKQGSWSSKNDYEDFVFLCHYFDSTEISPSLKNLQGHLDNQASLRTKQVNELKSLLKNNLLHGIELAKTISLHARWLEHVKTFQKSAINNTQTAYLIYRLLTHDKKNMLQQSNTHQNGSVVIAWLDELVHEKDYAQNPKSFIKYLEKTKKSSLKQIEAIEKELKNKYTHLESVIANLRLLVYPEYKLGEFTINNVLANMDQNHHLPTALQEPLPQSWIKPLQRIMGLSAVAFIIAGCYSTGYYFHLYTMLNRLVLAQVALYLKAGGFLENSTETWLKPNLEKLGAFLPQRFNKTIDDYLTTINPNEITLLEIESQLNWILGLGLNLLFSNMAQPLINTGAYIAATSGLYGLGRLSDHGADEYGFHSSTKNLFKFIASSYTYRLVYQNAFQLGLTLQTQRNKALSYSKALDTFGLFNKQPSKEEIKHRFHELAKNFHPDKNPNEHDLGNSMEDINEAYETLMSSY